MDKEAAHSSTGVQVTQHTVEIKQSAHHLGPPLLQMGSCKTPVASPVGLPSRPDTTVHAASPPNSHRVHSTYLVSSMMAAIRLEAARYSRRLVMTPEW